MTERSPDSHALRVLIVDDDEDDFVLTRSLLQDVNEHRFVAEWCRDYEAAFEHICAAAYDVYLLDYRLGPRSGLELLREALDAGCRAPLILLTGQGDQAVDLAAMEAGAADYLVKGELTAPVLERSLRYAVERKRVEAELAETQQQLAESPERERLRLAQELHDGPLQDLIGAWIHLGVVSDELPGATGERLDVTQDTLQKVIQRLRRICGELRPPTLGAFGLARAIRSHAGLFQETHPNIRVVLDLESDGARMSERSRLAFYRIYQTAIANVAQHAEANEVAIRLHFDDRSATLEVEDDGRGFRVPERWIVPARKGRLGILGARERAEAIDGRLTVTSTPGAGTLVRVTGPILINDQDLSTTTPEPTSEAAQ